VNISDISHLCWSIVTLLAGLWPTGRILSVVKNCMDNKLFLFNSVKNGKRKSTNQGAPDVVVMLGILLRHVLNCFYDGFHTIEKFKA
jgi:hypothetical protein